MGSFGRGRPLRVLIYRIGHLGDTVVALPSLWAIRRAFPEAHVAFLSQLPAHGYVGADAVLPAQGLIDEWLTYSLERAGRVAGMVALWSSLRQRRFDLLVYLAPRLRSQTAVWRDLLFFRLAGIRRFVGHRGFCSLPTRRKDEPLPPLEHEADHLLHRLALSGIPVPCNDQVRIDLALTSDERQAAELWLRTRIPEYSESLSLVGIGPWSNWPSKIWPEERFAELGSRLIREFHVYPVVFGGQQEATLAERLIGRWGRGTRAAGVLGVRAAASVLAHCRLYVGNDTGTTHLAAAVGTPCVAVFSAHDWPGRWYPYGPGHTVLRRAVPCEGCLRQVCPEQQRCLMEISTDEVMHACRATLTTPGPIRESLVRK